MYGDGTWEEKAGRLIKFYGWKEFTVEFIANILASIAGIWHIGRRMREFFKRLDEPDAYITVSGWLNLYNSPTVSMNGRIVVIPPLEGWNPFNWYAFENHKDINVWSKVQMGIEGTAYEVHIGSNGELIDAEGRYWIAVGPNVMNPNHQPEEEITLEEMQYGTKVDVVLRHDDGTIVYLPCIIGDVKAHTWPNGVLQTGYAFPNGVDYHPIPKIGWPIEFIGATLPDGLIEYEIVMIIVYD
jgi:hypothetical protein